ncbi:MAG: MmgE/PrpD family protein [Candidatus Binatia bacterium]
MGPTERLSQFVVETRAKDIPSQAMGIAKLVILDALGVILAGSRQPAARIITEYVRELGGAPRARVIGANVWTAPPLAALANGTMAFILDYDDNLHGSIHTLPAALALGEELRISGEQLLEVYILGREICHRLDTAIDAGRSQNLGGPTSRGWFAGGTTGSLAAAATAGKVLGLELKQMQMAFGIAASTAGGLRRNFGTMAKAFQGGSAARNGVTAALLAEKGFTADKAILEEPFGLINALCLEGECNWDAMTDSLGKAYYMERLPSIKAYPTCAPSHRPIEGILALRRRYGFGHEDVESIECDFHTRSLCRVDPQEGMAGHNSMPFILAVALLEGKVVVEQFTDDKVSDPLVRAVMSKVKHIPLAREKGESESPDRLTVKLKDGTAHSIEVAERRTLTTEQEIEAKYMECATMVLNADDAKRLHDMILHLDTLEDVSVLMQIVSGPG